MELSSLVRQNACKCRDIYSGQPEKLFLPPPLKFSPVFVDFPVLYFGQKSPPGGGEWPEYISLCK